MRLTAAILAFVVATPVTAFTAQNELIVRSDGQSTFTVPWQGPGGAADFWCAAGDYTIRGLHLNPTTVIYRASEPPRRAGEGIQFSLNPEDAASSTGLLILWPKGKGVTAGHAQSLCERRQARRR